MLLSFPPIFKDYSGPIRPPFRVKPWKEGLRICPVETVRLILQGRGCLHLTHCAIFFS
jgi:hypothetical protein